MSARLKSINGDQYAVLVDDEEAGFVGPANTGGWVAYSAEGRLLGSVPTRRDAVTIVCSEYGLSGIDR